MGRGVGDELTKSWPAFEQLCVQNLALAISCRNTFWENMSGELSVPVRGSKTGRHKRSSSKATAGISGEYF